MKMIRQYAVVHDGVVQVTVPEELNEHEVEVQVIVTAKTPDNEPEVKQRAGLGHLVGKFRYFTPEQNEKIDNDLNELRDSWERDIL